MKWEIDSFTKSLWIEKEKDIWPKNKKKKNRVNVHMQMTCRKEKRLCILFWRTRGRNVAVPFSRSFYIIQMKSNTRFVAQPNLLRICCRNATRFDRAKQPILRLRFYGSVKEATPKQSKNCIHIKGNHVFYLIIQNFWKCEGVASCNLSLREYGDQTKMPLNLKHLLIELHFPTYRAWWDEQKKLWWDI